jgi:hypothetical protein
VCTKVQSWPNKVRTYIGGFFFFFLLPLAIAIIGGGAMQQMRRVPPPELKAQVKGNHEVVRRPSPVAKPKTENKTQAKHSTQHARTLAVSTFFSCRPLVLGSGVVHARGIDMEVRHPPRLPWSSAGMLVPAPAAALLLSMVRPEPTSCATATAAPHLKRCTSVSRTTTEPGHFKRLLC